MLMVACHTVGHDKTSKITKRFLFSFTNLMLISFSNSWPC